MPNSQSLDMFRPRRWAGAARARCRKASGLVSGLAALGAGLLLFPSTARSQITITPASTPPPLEIEAPYRELETLTYALFSVQIPPNTGALSASVLAPVLTQGTPDPDGTVHEGFISRNGSEVNHLSSLTIAPTGSQPSTVELGVRMRVERPTAYTAGSYRYTVQLTIAPQ